MSIKPSSSSTPHIPLEVPASRGDKASASSLAANVVNPEAVTKSLKDYNKLKNLKKPFLKGAAGLFADNVNFSANLLDPLNPANDPKYLHLMSAMLGLDALENYFATVEQAEEEDDDESSERRESPDSSEKEPLNPITKNKGN